MTKATILAFAVLFFQAVSAYPQDDCGYVTKKDFPTAATVEDLDLFGRSISGNNAALFLKLRQEGRAKMSVAGVEVCIVEKMDADKIRIRPKGGTSAMWTLAEAVHKKGTE